MCDCLVTVDPETLLARTISLVTVDPETLLARTMSQQIDRELLRAKQERRKEHIILLLGTRESGKSTFIKQMRVIHGQGYSDADRADFRSFVFRNIFTAVNALTEAMTSLKIPFQSAANKESGTVYGRKKDEEVTVLSESDRDKLKAFWLDRGVQSCFERRNEFQISDSAKYYLDSLNRICSLDYLPTIQDVLRIQIATTGIVEYTFQVRGVMLRMVDQGCLTLGRRPWMHCFNNVKAIVFITAINEYDQVVHDCFKETKLHKSLELFRKLLSNPYFRNCVIFLFLNKTDLFAEKIMKSHLNQYFPEYTGPQRDVQSGREFILHKFRELCHPERNLHCCFMCETDTDGNHGVMEYLRDGVIEHLWQMWYCDRDALNRYLLACGTLAMPIGESNITLQ